MRYLVWLLAFLSLGEAHIVFTYPGSRGNNLITNETFPYAMQWTYPCQSPQNVCRPPALTVTSAQAEA